MLFVDEVTNMDELIDKLSELDMDIDEIKVAVVCFIFDDKGKLTLHRRGPGARDEIGKLLAIGGSVNGSDKTFRDALKRELTEEAGDKATIRIDDFIGAQLDGKIDRHTSKFINWIILGYTGMITSGELINSEPDRCVGFEKAFMEEFREEELSKTAYNFIKQIIDTKK